MNTTQNTQRIIATAVMTITAVLALASCAQQSARAGSNDDEGMRMQDASQGIDIGGVGADS